MNQNGKGEHRGTGRGQRGGGEGGYCVCAQCGYSANHVAGLPCKTMVCPDCHVPLFRSAVPGKHPGSAQNNAQAENANNTGKKIQFPKVVSEKCTACSSCIDICPQGAIVMKEGKAFIETENCRNCRKCIKACPVKAIILE